jgi:HSP20 family protein
VERAYGQFTRAFTLPETADPTKINAEFKDGMLTVHLTKAEKAQPKAVDVKVT